MFRRLPINLPKEPKFPANLEKLGYRITDGGRVESTGKCGTSEEPEGRCFKFFISGSENINYLHKEAMHEALREEILGKLAELNVRRIYLGGRDGSTIMTERPSEAHVSVLVSEDMETLKRKKHVVVVVGEHTQDLGIWSWRKVMSYDGIDAGSATALAKRLKEVSFGSPKASAPISKSQNKSKKQDVGKKDAAREDDGYPGLIILNSGQLLYSHVHMKNMTLVSWNTRRRPNVLVDPPSIHEVYNRAGGHSKSTQHIATVFDQVLPKLLGDQVSLYIVGIADGADDLAAHIDEQLGARKHMWAADKIKAFAAIQSTYVPAQFKSEKTQDLLRERGCTWELSSEPRETILSTPGVQTLAQTMLPKAATRASIAEEKRSLRNVATQSNTETDVAVAENSDVTCATKVITETGDEGVVKPDPSTKVNQDNTSAMLVHETEDNAQDESTQNVVQLESHSSDDYKEDRPLSVSVTVSSGIEDVVETIFPAVLADILAFFRNMAAEGACGNIGH